MPEFFKQPAEFRPLWRLWRRERVFSVLKLVGFARIYDCRGWVLGVDVIQHDTGLQPTAYNVASLHFDSIIGVFVGWCCYGWPQASFVWTFRNCNCRSTYSQSAILCNNGLILFEKLFFSKKQKYAVTVRIFAVKWITSEYEVKMNPLLQQLENYWGKS